jgi:hypothetical protein
MVLPLASTLLLAMTGCGSIPDDGAPVPVPGRTVGATLCHTQLACSDNELVSRPAEHGR